MGATTDRFEHRRKALIPLLKDADPGVRESAAAALEDLESLQGLDRLLWATGHGSRGERIRAIFTLERVGRGEVFPVLLGLLRDPEADIRATAVQVLGQKRHPKTIAALLQQLKDPSPAVRVYVAEALANFEEKRLIPYFSKMLAARDPLLAAAAVRGLARTRARETEEVLLKCLGDGRPEVRREAAQALTRIEI